MNLKRLCQFGLCQSNHHHENHLLSASLHRPVQPLSVLAVSYPLIFASDTGTWVPSSEQGGEHLVLVAVIPYPLLELSHLRVHIKQSILEYSGFLFSNGRASDVAICV